MKWANQKHFPDGLNDTIISLIPKCDAPDNMKDLRPISLCNVLHKVFAKTITNRLKIVLPKVISEFQSAFFLGRAITDNILLAFEIIHSMKRNKKAKVGDVALKIDISKAYDRVDWGFLERMMLKLGFDRNWTDLVMLCVRTVNYTALVNGEPVGPIVPQRGLRQRCPLSPYMFIICAQGLSCLVDRAVTCGDVHMSKSVVGLLRFPTSFSLTTVSSSSD